MKGKKWGKQIHRNYLGKHIYICEIFSFANMTTNYDYLVPPTIKSDVEMWIKEDLPGMDIGGFVVGDKLETAHLLCKSPCMLSGKPWAQAVFDYFDLKVVWNFDDGAIIDGGGTNSNKIITAVVTGPCRQILMAERTALNILSRASGVATAAWTAKKIADDHAWLGMVAGTRKTTPGFRGPEKYSLIVAKCHTHRIDLSQMVMLKDNHIMSAGSITKAVKHAKQAAGFSHNIEVECRSSEEAIEAAEAGADIVMLDNFRPETIHMAAQTVKERFPHVIVEASGGITEETMHLFMSQYVDVISRGSLTQGYPCMDFSLKIQKASWHPWA